MTQDFASTDTEIQQENRSAMDVEAEDFCWICLDDSSKQALIQPCRCPRSVHPRCLARWQLQQAGRPEETQCRFCNRTLADWKSSLTPETLKPEVDKVQPIMVVYFEGEIHRIPVKQGGDGLKEFTNRIRELFRLPEDVDISLTFGCKEPMSGQHLKLEGIGAFDAAVHCASVAAAERQQKIRSAGGSAISNAGGTDGGGSHRSSNHSVATPAQPFGAAMQPEHAEASYGDEHNLDDTSDAEAEGETEPHIFCPSPMNTEADPAANAAAANSADNHAPSPFMHGPPTWPFLPDANAFHDMEDTPDAVLTEQLLLQQHLQQLPLPMPMQLPEGPARNSHHHHSITWDSSLTGQQDPSRLLPVHHERLAPPASFLNGHRGSPLVPSSAAGHSSFASNLSQPSPMPSVFMPNMFTHTGSLAPSMDLPISNSEVIPNGVHGPLNSQCQTTFSAGSDSSSSPRQSNVCSITSSAPSARRVCRSGSRVGEAPPPSAAAETPSEGGAADEPSDSFSGRLKTGVRTLAKKLAHSLGRMVKHPDDVVFNFPEGQGANSFVCTSAPPVDFTPTP